MLLHIYERSHLNSIVQVHLRHQQKPSPHKAVFFVGVLWYNAHMFSRPYFLTAILSIVILVVHAYADANSLYFVYKWLDIPMHLFGGFVVALLGVCICSLYNQKIEKTIFWALILLFVLVIGSFWEIFELSMSVLYHVQTMDLTNIYDTVSDLINDTIGAIGALYINHKKHWYVY